MVSSTFHTFFVVNVDAPLPKNCRDTYSTYLVLISHNKRHIVLGSAPELVTVLKIYVFLLEDLVACYEKHVARL